MMTCAFQNIYHQVFAEKQYLFKLLVLSHQHKSKHKTKNQNELQSPEVATAQLLPLVQDHIQNIHQSGVHQ